MDHQTSQFEEILLPPVLLAGLYSHSLVVIGESGIIQKKLQPKVLSQVREDDLIKLSSTGTVEEPSSTNLLEPTIQQRISRLGEFNKNILVLVHDEKNVHLGEKELDLLSKMLQALKLSLADIALVNCGKQPILWPALTSELFARHILFFGVDPASIQLPIRLPNFRVHNWNESRLLYSPSLETINTISPDQTTLKKELWKSLQELFSI
ncbi:MAG: hypothetical protein V4717_17360 [Bacteroidota bacterium]